MEIKKAAVASILKDKGKIKYFFDDVSILLNNMQLEGGGSMAEEEQIPEKEIYEFEVTTESLVKILRDGNFKALLRSMSKIERGFLIERIRDQLRLVDKSIASLLYEFSQEASRASHHAKPARAGSSAKPARIASGMFPIAEDPRSEGSEADSDPRVSRAG